MKLSDTVIRISRKNYEYLAFKYNFRSREGLERVVNDIVCKAINEMDESKEICMSQGNKVVPDVSI